MHLALPADSKRLRRMQAHCLDEVEEFVNISSALLINMGTLQSDWLAAKKLATAQVRTPLFKAACACSLKAAGSLNGSAPRVQAVATGKPWVLDPVGCGATQYRTRACVQMLGCKPTVVRGNGSEILALAGAAGSRHPHTLSHPCH